MTPRLTFQIKCFVMKSQTCSSGYGVRNINEVRQNGDRF